MLNILQCICQDSNQQSYKVLFNMFFCSDLACITRSSLHLKLSTTLRRVSWSIFSHAFLRESFNASTKSWDEAQASASKMNQTQKSIVFKSGVEGGQTSLLRK